ncbi:MAG: response regulator transcription factor [Tannerellaceae bacterium]|nr:response regulator transcription factor [Tannerellaceae bacterium]
MRTIILADNQELTKAGILYLCEQTVSGNSIKEVCNRKELITQLNETPDAVVILDYTLFDLTSIDDLFILQTRFADMSWLLLSEQLSEDFLRRLVYSDEAFCLVLKESPASEIQLALKSALRYEPYICGRIAQLLLHNRYRPKEQEKEMLATTEKDILKLIALGKTTKEIASERFSSVHTITTHRKNIFRKLEVNNVHEATKYALRAGIIDSAEYYI